MTNRDEEIKAAIIVTDDMISFASPEMNRAAEYAALELHAFVDFIQSIDATLTRAEATILAGTAIQNLPELFRLNPALIDSIKVGAAFLRSKRSVK